MVKCACHCCQKINGKMEWNGSWFQRQSWLECLSYCHFHQTDNSCINTCIKKSINDRQIREKKKYKYKLKLQKSQMASYTLLAETSPNPTLHCHAHCLSGNRWRFYVEAYNGGFSWDSSLDYLYINPHLVETNTNLMWIEITCDSYQYWINLLFRCL